MNSKRNDSRQAFAEVVAVEAWHVPFSDVTRVTDLCVDVVFGTARLGDESNSPVRFRLAIRQAEVVVVVPEVEPVTVDPASVSRDAPHFKGQATTRRTDKRSIWNGGGVFAALSGSRITGAGAVGLGGERSRSRSTDIELAADIQNIAITQARSDDGHYRWRLVPQLGESLVGRPWDATKSPRMKLVDRRSKPEKEIPPSVRVEVRCRREDLLITDVALKDENLWARLKGKSGHQNRLAAAESLIRDRLIEDGLEVGDMHELFARITLASVHAMPVPPQ